MAEENGQIGDGLGDFDGIEGVLLSRPCMAIFKTLYIVDGLALIIVAIMALNGEGEFSEGSNKALYFLGGNGCAMILIGLISCCAIWTKKFNNTCLCIIYCLLVSAVVCVNLYAVYIINTAGDGTIDGTFVKALDAIIVFTTLLNIFGYASVLRTNEGARNFMNACCGGGDN